MLQQTDILIIGGGPGGLACAKLLAEKGRQVVLVERKPQIGPKVCAGGITWSGLIKHVPESLIQRAFPEQHIVTRLQRINIKAKNPIIATINREALGQWMAEDAKRAGAVIYPQAQALSYGPASALLQNGEGKKHSIQFKHLVGADGSNSRVRKYLGLKSTRVGIGLNAYLPLDYKKMEWHLNTRHFGSGYGWLFPHHGSLSIGAYGDTSRVTAKSLKQNLLHWAQELGIRIPLDAIQAGLINYDYQGICFGNTWLVGDAAGLASGLTGEGIYPAIVSGRAVAKQICDPQYPALEIERMVQKQHVHNRVIAKAQKNERVCTVLMEVLAFLLRLKLLDFHTLEMAE